jgi:hypothetical protein
MRKLTTVVLVLGLLPMLACAPLQEQARDAAAALSGSIVAAQTKYQASCTANPAQEVCRVINRGVSGENALIRRDLLRMGFDAGSSRPNRQMRSRVLGAGRAASGRGECRNADTSDQRSSLMGAATLISLILTLLQSVLASAKVGGLAPDVIGNIEAAVTSLLAVQGTPVTFAQLEGLRVTTKW